MSLIVALGTAASVLRETMASEVAETRRLRDKFESGLFRAVPEIVLNGHPTERLPNTVNISFRYVEGEAILLMLNEHGVCASSGSACTSGSLEPSHVLSAMGIPPERSHGAIRFSLGRENTEADIDKLLEVLPKVVENLRSFSLVARGNGQEDGRGWYIGAGIARDTLYMGYITLSYDLFLTWKHVADSVWHRPLLVHRGIVDAKNGNHSWTRPRFQFTDREGFFVVNETNDGSVKNTYNKIWLVRFPLGSPSRFRTTCLDSVPRGFGAFSTDFTLDSRGEPVCAYRWGTKVYDAGTAAPARASAAVSVSKRCWKIRRSPASASPPIPRKWCFAKPSEPSSTSRSTASPWIQSSSTAFCPPRSAMPGSPAGAARRQIALLFSPFGVSGPSKGGSSPPRERGRSEKSWD